MSLETGTYVSDLNQSNPPGGDRKAQGDDHIRLVKSVLKGTFPDAAKAFYFPKILQKTANYSAVATDDNTLIEVSAAGGAFTLTLPTLVAGLAGYTLHVAKTDNSANAVTVVGAGSENIDGVATLKMRHTRQMITFIWNGTAWTTNRNAAIAEPIAKTADATLTEDEIDFIVATAAVSAITLTLPAVATVRGRLLIVKKLTAANSVILDGNGAETVEGATTLTLLAANETVVLYSTGAAWLIVSRNVDVAGANIWTGIQTYNAAVVFGFETGTPGSTVTFDFSKQPHKQVTVNQNTTIAASNLQNGQFGTLSITQDGTGRTITFSADYTVLDGAACSPVAGSTTRYNYVVIGSKVILRKFSVTGRSTIGIFIEYNLGVYTTGPVITTTNHDLGRYPSLAVFIAECISTDLGFAVGERLQWFNSAPLDSGGGGNNSGLDLCFSTTTVTTIINVLTAHRKSDSLFALLSTASKWNMYLRVYE